MAVLGASSLQINSATLGSQTGSAPMFAARAWVNFDGTTSPGTIRANGNVSSVTRNGTGDYTINFATAMPDANYALIGITGRDIAVDQRGLFSVTSGNTASSAGIADVGNFFYSSNTNMVAIFR
jgi:hypothetical protein